MRWSSWLGLLQSRCPRTLVRRPRQPAAPLKKLRHRLFLERLEDRTVPSTVTWINPVGGDWDTPGNWSSGTLPGSADDAVINLGANNFTVTHSSGVDAIHSLTSQAPFNLAGGSLTIAADSTISNSLTIAGTLINGGTITVMGLLDFPSGTLQGVNGGGRLVAA